MDTSSKPNIYEGTWEEILANSREWQGRRLRLAVLDEPGDAAISGVVRPTMGSGTYEDVLRLVHSFSPEANEANLLDAIQESRKLRREAAEEQNL